MHDLTVDMYKWWQIKATSKDRHLGMATMCSFHAIESHNSHHNVFNDTNHWVISDSTVLHFQRRVLL